MNMNQPIPDNNSDKRDLEAMLYVLRDPAIDCETFEARMIDEPLLAEAVSHAVSLVFAIKNQNEVNVERQSLTKPTLATPTASVAMPKFSFDPAWMALATISALISLFLLNLDYTSKDSSLEPMVEVATAWTDLQSTKMEQPSSDTKNETSLTSHFDLDDSSLGLETKSLDNDLPDWILLAAIASDSMNAEMVQ
jgi:hypothetical protein